jgi:hypothetical protein
MSESSFLIVVTFGTEPNLALKLGSLDRTRSRTSWPLNSQDTCTPNYGYIWSCLFLTHGATGRRTRYVDVAAINAPYGNEVNI